MSCHEELETVRDLQSHIADKLFAIGEEYRGLSDRNGNRGFGALFEGQRRGIGRAHQLRTIIVELTKQGIQELQRSLDHTGDIPHSVQLIKEKILAKKEELAQVIQVPEQALQREHEAGQEWVEFAYFVAFYPVIANGAQLPNLEGPDELLVEPRVFLNGLCDVVSELRKILVGNLLGLDEEKFTTAEVMRRRTRYVSVAHAICRFLEEYELTYGLVIDIGRSWHDAFKNKVRRARENLCREQENLLAAREREQADKEYREAIKALLESK